MNASVDCSESDSEHRQSFGTAIKSGSDENSVVRCDESGGSIMGSKALQSSWIQRLRSGGHSLKLRETESERQCAGKRSRICDGRIGSKFNVNLDKDPSGSLRERSNTLLLEDKIEVANVEKESESAMYTELLPHVDNMLVDPSKANEPPRTWASACGEDLGAQTRAIASFGHFQVSTKPSVSDVRLAGKPTLASVSADNWKQYFDGLRNEQPFEQRPTGVISGISRWDIKPGTNNVVGDKREFRGEFLEPVPIDSYYKAMVSDREKSRPRLERNPYYRVNHAANNNGKSSQLQWQAERQQPGPLGQIVGLGNQMMSSTENCSNHCFVGQQLIWKQGSESFPMVKVTQFENRKGKHCTEPYYLAPILGQRTFGIAQELGRFDTMERPPAYTAMHTGFGNQKDDMIPTDNSSSTERLPSEVYAKLYNRTTNQKNSSEFHVCRATGTASIRQTDARYYRRAREDYPELESNSSHFSNCSWLHQKDIATGAENKHLKQPEIARHGQSDAKGKGPNIGKIPREQWPDTKCIGSSKGAASHDKSDDDVIHKKFQENYSGPFSPCSGSWAIFQSVPPAVQPVALSIPSKAAPETVTVRDGHEKQILKKDKRFSAVGVVLQAKESPTGNSSYFPNEMNLDGREYYHIKSRRQSAEAGPTSKRVLISSNERESEFDCDKYARLKISAGDGQTLSSGKRTRCTLEDNRVLVPTNTVNASKAATMSEVNAGYDCRPQMWLQRWISSGGSVGLLRNDVSRGNSSCNLVTNVGLFTRSSFGEWSGDNSKADVAQWMKRR